MWHVPYNFWSVHCTLSCDHRKTSLTCLLQTLDSPSLDCQDVPKHVNENLIHPNGYLISWGWLREALDRFWLLIKFSVLWPLNLWWSEKININTKNAASKETMHSAENRSDAFWWPMMKLSQCHRIILRWAICHFPWEVGCFLPPKYSWCWWCSLIIDGEWIKLQPTPKKPKILPKLWVKKDWRL